VDLESAGPAEDPASAAKRRHFPGGGPYDAPRDAAVYSSRL
jgi:hypothetical protein